jgi:serine/threonine-protein kinase
VYVHAGTLFAAPLDLDRLELTGPPGPVIEGIASDTRTGGAHYAFCDAGTFAYHPGSNRGTRTNVLTVDRDGSSTVLLEEVTSYVAPALSPAADRLALGIETTGTGDIWVYEFERENLIRLTFDQADDMTPIWTPDGSRILFCSTRETNTPNLFWKLSNGSGPAERLSTSDNAQFATCISPDGKFVVFDEQHDDTGWDIWTMPLDGDRTPVLFLQTPFDEGNGVLSPDGRWICYSSDESGESQVYVRAFPDTGGKWLVSTDGGDHPLWGPTGTELYYLRAGTIMVAKVSTEGTTFRADRSEVLIDDEYLFPLFFRPYDVSEDGLTFVLTTEHSDENAGRSQITFVFNWFEELKQRVPTN